MSLSKTVYPERDPNPPEPTETEAEERERILRDLSIDDIIDIVHDRQDYRALLADCMDDATSGNSTPEVRGLTLYLIMRNAADKYIDAYKRGEI